MARARSVRTLAVALLFGASAVVASAGNRAAAVSFSVKPLRLAAAFVPVAGDFDADGNGDVLLYGSGARDDAIWWGDGDRTFTKVALTIDSEGFRPVVADFDADGADDVFFFGPGPDRDEYVLFGAGSRALTRVEAPRNARSDFVVTAGDYDGDGYGELLLYGPGAPTDHVWEGRPGRVFRSRGLEPMLDLTDVRLVSGDFSGDGRDDIYFYGVGAQIDFVWLGNANGTFALRGTRPVRLADYRPVAGDYDGDGRDDLFFYGLGDATEHVRRSLGDGDFEVIRTRRQLRSARLRLAAADFDADSRADLFVHAPGPGGDAVLYADAANGGLRPARDHQVSEDLAYFIESYEGFSAQPYNDVLGNCTIGYGRLLHLGRCTSADDQTTTEAAEHAWVLERTNTAYAEPVRALGDLMLTQSQFDALVSVAYGGPYGATFRYVIAPLQAAPPDLDGPAARLRNRQSQTIGGNWHCYMWNRRLDEAEIYEGTDYTKELRTCPSGAIGPAERPFATAAGRD